MNKKIDCLFIGHNEMKFVEYEKMIRTMGEHSCSYRDLNLNFIRHNNKILTASEAFNEFHQTYVPNDESFKPVFLGDTFSLTIAYLGTFLKKRGFSFDYVNSFQFEKEALVQKLKNNDFLTIAIPTTLYVTVFPILEIISFVRKYNKTAKIIIGGPFIATQMNIQDDMTIQYLFNSMDADFYIKNSQGEQTLANLLYALKNNLSVNDIKNITYRSSDKYITNPEVPENNILEENPIEWDFFKDRIDKFVSIRTSISCPFSCTFCGFPQHAGKYQTADIKFIENELNMLNSIGSITSVNFIDDTFNVPVKRFKEILRMMIKNKYNFKWNSHFRCQFADEETIHLMKESGCEGVFLGIESGNQQILQNMNKAAKLADYRKGLELLRKYDITTYASFIIGFPGETRETVKDTIEFIEENKPTFFRTQLWYCDPITPIWKQREKYNIQGSQFEWSHATMDSHTACNIIDEIFFNVKNSMWIPQTNFEFEGIFNLIHRGMSLDQVKGFLEAFNLGMKEKLLNKGHGEISYDVINKFKRVFDNSYASELEALENKSDNTKKIYADFEF